MSNIAEEFDIMPEETTESISAEETADQEIQEQESSDEKSGFDDMNNPDPDEFDFDDDDDDEDSNADDNEAGDEDIDTDDEESSDEEPKVQQISQEQLFQAAQAGLSLEEVNEIKDPAALDLVIKMAQNRKADGQSGNGAGSQQEEEKPAYTFEPFKPEIPEDYDDETKALINGMAESFNKKFEEMTGIMNGLDKSSKEAESKYQQEMQQQAVNMFTEWFDNHCQSQEAWSDILGTGSIDDLNENSDAHKNRNKLIMEMDRQAQAHPELQGDKIKLFDKALLNAFPDVYSNKKAKAKQDKITDHKQKRATQKPTGKRKKALKHIPQTKQSSVQTALKAIKGFWK